MDDIQLSDNFRLSELVKSSTADRLGIDNWPTEQEVVDNLRATVGAILQPIREHYGVAISPNSGYRSLELNRALKSKDTSQHVKGQAVDIEVPGIGNYELAEWIMNTLDFDQLLLEFFYPGQPTSGWVHASYVSPEENKKQVLTINKNGVFAGLLT
jgi:zinc D-Ala-D-Ala carboxypeptidase